MLHRLRKKIYRALHPATVNSQLHGKELEINAYGRQLSPQEIAAKKHRVFVGGLWEEMGQLQFQFLKAQGLLPEHKLLDIGCGAMRGGIHFVKYLDKGNYYGLDINKSLIDAAEIELGAVGLLDKSPHLLVNEKFELSLFGTKFDVAIAISVFTHLFLNNIMRCLVEVRGILQPNGKFYATFFQAPNSAYLNSIFHSPGVVTYYDHDPFHYSFSEMQNLAAAASLDVRLIEDWSHPRGQKMLCFTRQCENE